ncbi:MAG TPA: FecR family protein [Spirochaetota bacterium]|nr:FecR family protein [Spirochaetota bacterium]HOM38988.1 FecR family protein [Spirochaetota bacterium]HPQ48353.1 FecR family protein [Spirochaetota bacterium]
MKKILFFIIITLLIFGCGKKTQTVEQQNKAKVIFIQGMAYKSFDGNKWENINVNEELTAPVILKTDKKSVLRIFLWENTTFTLYSESIINLSELDSQKVNIDMKKGTIINNIETLKGKVYSCKTPAISAGVRGTVFKIETDGKKDTLIVSDGKVWVKRNIENAPEIIVEKGKKVVITVDENEKIKQKIKNLKKEEANKILEIETEDVGDDIIKEELNKQEEYIENETKKQQEFTEKKSKEIEELKEKKSEEIEKSIEKKSKDIEDMMNKDINDMDSLLKKAKEKKLKK